MAHIKRRNKQHRRQEGTKQQTKECTSAGQTDWLHDVNVPFKIGLRYDMWHCALHSDSESIFYYVVWNSNYDVYPFSFSGICASCLSEKQLLVPIMSTSYMDMVKYQYCTYHNNKVVSLFIFNIIRTFPTTPLLKFNRYGGCGSVPGEDGTHGVRVCWRVIGPEEEVCSRIRCL